MYFVQSSHAKYKENSTITDVRSLHSSQIRWVFIEKLDGQY